MHKIVKLFPGEILSFINKIMMNLEEYDIVWLL